MKRLDTTRMLLAAGLVVALADPALAGLATDPVILTAGDWSVQTFGIRGESFRDLLAYAIIAVIYLGGACVISLILMATTALHHPDLSGERVRHQSNHRGREGRGPERLLDNQT